MNLMEAKHAQKIRENALMLQCKIKEIMSDPLEYLENGYWTLSTNELPASTDPSFSDEVLDWVKQWLSKYGWNLDTDFHISPFTEQQPVETNNTVATPPDNQSRNSPPPSRITHWSEEDIFDSDYPD